MDFDMTGLLLETIGLFHNKQSTGTLLFYVCCVNIGTKFKGLAIIVRLLTIFMMQDKSLFLLSCFI